MYLNDGKTSGFPGPLLTDVSVSGLTTGTGIEVAGCSVIIQADAGLALENCKYGTKLRGGSSVVLRQMPGGTGGVIAIDGCTTGLYAADSTEVDAQDVTVSPTAYGIGIYTDGNASGAFSSVSIVEGATGLKAYSAATHALRTCVISDFKTYGVQVSLTGMPDLGASQDDGNNLITSSESGVLKYVSAKTRLAGLDPVAAEENWWSTQGSAPSSSLFSAVNVDYSPWKTTQYNMSSSRRKPGIAVVAPIEPSLAFGPNPFAGPGQIFYSLPAGAGAYQLELFDVQGRRVRLLDEGNAGDGFDARFNWDGRGDTGRTVAHGIYFLRLASPVYTRTVKIVRLP